MATTKSNVLVAFKRLHRIARKVFNQDVEILSAARLKINEEFKKNKNIQNSDEIHKLIKLSMDVGDELKTNVIQAQETKPGVYRLNITDDVLKLDNVMFNENAELPKGKIPKCK